MFIHRILITFLCLAACSSANVTAATVEPVPEYTNSLLASVLTPNQLSKTLAAIRNPAAYGSLGPILGYQPDLSAKPAASVVLPLSGVAGDGSMSRPWRGAISAYLKKFQIPAEPSAFRVSEWGVVDPALVNSYMSKLPYQPVAIQLPAGYYLEDTIEVPPGVWLMSDRSAHLQILPPSQRANASATFLRLRTRSGLVGVEVSGKNIPDFVSAPPIQINAMEIGHFAEVHNNYIHHWTGKGILSAGTRSRESNYSRITNNIIEYIGYSGVRIGDSQQSKRNQNS